jgi:2-polyprenyl-3-methyl-5-hydroxy-6-metoxy-1,4-benzoquinol methylase
MREPRVRLGIAARSGYRSRPNGTSRSDAEFVPPMTAVSPAHPTARTVAVFLGGTRDAAALVRAVRRVPAELRARLAEIAVIVGVERDEEALPAELRDLAQSDALVSLRADARHADHGQRRKVAYEYALQHGFDFVAVLRPDDRHPPERLGELLDAALGGAQLVVAARRGRARGRSLLDRVLALDLGDWASPYRVLACSALRRVPFHLNQDGRGFDTELAIQFRALGARLAAVECDLEGDSSFSPSEALRTAFGYRAHQLHLTRDGKWFVDRDVRYTLKSHASSSHAQVLDAIRPGALVLDLGCSQGVLAAPLARKGVQVVGVDVRSPAEVSLALARYYQHDLEQPLAIPEGRVFDYVVCSDVIEHVLRRAELLASVRRYLKPDGRLLISTPNIAIWFYRLSLLVGRFEYGPRGVLDETHVHLFTRATFRREIESAAFRIVRERVTALPFEVVFESTGRSAVVSALASLYHLAARLWPTLFAYQFLLEAEVGTLLDPERRSAAT